MKKKKAILFGVLVGICGSLLAGTQVPKDCNPCELEDELRGDACTVLIVGKDASTDGSIMSTHTCDCGVCDWTWRIAPAADHEEGAMRKIYHFDQFATKHPSKGLKWDTYEEDFTGLEIPQVPHTYRYLHGMFGYMNDQQVALAESTIGCRDKMKNPTPSAKFDITMLTLIAMERASTAREAIQIMGDLATKHGYGHTDSGEMLAVSDPNEIWIFEVMPVGPLWTPESGKPGAIWAAQRVPDDHVSICPNESRIGEIDLDNSDYFMASENVTSYAVKKKYWDPESGEPFNWKKAYSPSETSATKSKGSRARLWRFLDLVAPSQEFSPDTPNMELPFSVKPEKKLSVHDVMMYTRDKFEGTPFNPADGLQGGPFANPNHLPYGFELDGKKYKTARMIGVNRAEYIAVTQTRRGMPNDIAGLVWIGLGGMDTTCYMPFYLGVNSIPPSFKIGDHWVFDRKSARWAFDYVDFHSQVFYSYAIKDVRKAQEKWELGAVNRIAAIDEQALKLYDEDPALARQFLTDFSVNNANLVVNAWWDLGDQLLVKFNHLWIYDTEARKRDKPEYPEWWLRELVRQKNLVAEPEEEE